MKTSIFAKIPRIMASFSTQPDEPPSFLASSQNPGDAENDVEDENEMDEDEDGVNESVRVQLRQGYRSLMEDVSNKEDLHMSQEEEHDVILDAMQKADVMFDRVRRPQEYLLDGQIVSHLSRQVRQRAQDLSTNVQTFSVGEFAGKLVSQLSGGGAVEDIAKEHWVHMGERVGGATFLSLIFL